MAEGFLHVQSSSWSPYNTVLLVIDFHIIENSKVLF